MSAKCPENVRILDKCPENVRILDKCPLNVRKMSENLINVRPKGKVACVVEPLCFFKKRECYKHKEMDNWHENVTNT